MYYTTSGSYKKTKMIIDYTNIVLTIAATVIFIIIMFLRSRSGVLFPIEFLLGTVVNTLTAVKHFINGNKVSGVIVAVVAVLLGIMTVFYCTCGIVIIIGRYEYEIRDITFVKKCRWIHIRTAVV